MRYNKIDTKLFRKNRKNFITRMKPNSVAFFNSNDIYPISADSTLPFEQNRDFFYLSGVDQEESVLMLTKNYKDITRSEVLFLKKTSPSTAVWEGPKLDKDQAYEISGIENIFWLEEMESIIDEVIQNCEIITFLLKYLTK